MDKRTRQSVNHQLKIADKAFWDWFIHTDEPPPAWWERVGPYCNWLKALRDDGLIPPA
jgi:hypothetical protein